jgi:hypothetical protein
VREGAVGYAQLAYIGDAASQSGGGNQVDVAPYTLQLHGAAGITVHTQIGTTPVVSTNGHTVNMTLSGTTYVVTNQKDIQGYTLDVVVPQNMNLDLQVQNGGIEVDDIAGQMTLTVGQGNITLNNDEFAGTSQLQVTNGGISSQYGALAGDSTTFSVGQGYITVSHFPSMLAFQLNSTPKITAPGCSDAEPSDLNPALLNLTASTISMSCS